MAKPIDFQAVKESLAALDRIAAEHPHLLGKSTPEEWEEILSEIEQAGRPKTVAERQKDFRQRRAAKGLIRPEVWLEPSVLESLRKAFPGPRAGVNWPRVIAAALEKTDHSPEAKPEKREAAAVNRLRARFAHIPPGESMSEELIAERRQEAMQESAP
jgi:hypothetical protein